MNQQEQEQLRRLLAGYVSNSPRMSMLSPQTAALGASPSPRHVSPDDLLSLATLQAEQRRLMLARMQSARSLGLMQAPNLMANAPTPAFLPQQPPMQQHFVPNAQPPAASHLPNIMPTLAPPRQQVAVPSQIPIVDHSERSSAMSVSARGGADNPHRVYVDVIRENDVLCGRGGKSNNHPGNKRYRHVISEMKRAYRKTDTKSQKTDLARAIVEHVVNYGGRFVKHDAAAGRHYLLTKAEARKKTSQALRETKELKWTM